MRMVDSGAAVGVSADDGGLCNGRDNSALEVISMQHIIHQTNMLQLEKYTIRRELGSVHH